MTRSANQLQTYDRIDATRVMALNATLGIEGSEPRPFVHQIFFWDAQPEQNLGQDGHPKTGSLIPDMGLPRRMWAGGRLEFNMPLTPNVEAVKSTTLKSHERKTGRTGDLAIITLRHEISQEGCLKTVDEQDLIYRAAADPDAPRPIPPQAPTDETFYKKRDFSTTLLFRYSALTFNGHRIHYDRDYAKDVEGYPGLVVHGPLLAQYLMLLAEEELGQLKAFSFRATAPMFDFETAEFCAKADDDGLTLWVRAQDGRQCMTALAR